MCFICLKFHLKTGGFISCISSWVSSLLRLPWFPKLARTLLYFPSLPVRWWLTHTNACWQFTPRADRWLLGFSSKAQFLFALSLLSRLGHWWVVDGMMGTPLMKVLCSLAGRANSKITFYNLTLIRLEETFLVVSQLFGQTLNSPMLFGFEMLIPAFLWVLKHLLKWPILITQKPLYNEQP